MTRQGPIRWMVAAAATTCAGCTFGDEPVQKAEPVIADWFDQNCVPVECMLECCDGWNWKKQPLIQGGQSYGPECEKVAQRNSAYAEYAGLMAEQWNYCSPEFADFEGGSCYIIEPTDAIEGFRPDGQPVHSGVSFLVCPPKGGQPVAYPLEDVEFIPQE